MAVPKNVENTVDCNESVLKVSKTYRAITTLERRKAAYFGCIIQGQKYSVTTDYNGTDRRAMMNTNNSIVLV